MREELSLNLSIVWKTRIVFVVFTGIRQKTSGLPYDKNSHAPTTYSF